MTPNTSRPRTPWGVGPVVGLVTLAYMLVAMALTHRFPTRFAIDAVPAPCLAVTASLLGLAGTAIYLPSVYLLNVGMRKGMLVTHGPYAVSSDGAGAVSSVRTGPLRTATRARV